MGFDMKLTSELEADAAVVLPIPLITGVDIGELIRRSLPTQTIMILPVGVKAEASLRERIDYYTEAIAARRMSVNQVREAEGLPPLGSPYPDAPDEPTVVEG